MKALQEECGIGNVDHVGEHLVVVNAENCCKVEVVCTAPRSGEIHGVLSNVGVGIDFGTMSSVSVASMRPHPTKLLDQFTQMKERLKENFQSKITKPNDDHVHKSSSTM